MLASTSTYCSEREVDVRHDLDVLVRVDVRLADLRHLADRDVARVERREPVAGLLAGRHHEVALVDGLVLADAFEEEQVLGALAVADDADRAGLVVLCRDVALLVGEERDEGRVAEDLRDVADEAVLGDDRVVDADAVLAAGRDHDRLVELAGGIGQDLGSHRSVRVVRVGRQLLDLQDLLVLRRLLRGRGDLDRLLTPLLDVLAQLLVLVLRVEDVRRPVVSVLERARDAIRGDLERAQDGRARALEAVQAAVRRLPEIDRDHHQRDEHEQADDEPPAPGA